MLRSGGIVNGMTQSVNPDAGRSLRVGVIGVGVMGSNHARVFAGLPGAELVGPLPAEINSYVMFTAAVSAQSAHQQAARELIKLLQSPAASAMMKIKGLEPVATP